MSNLLVIHTRTRFKFFGIGYLLVVIGLFFYSFTQVDLSLTLSRLSVWQSFEKFFQYVGYFQRPLSTYLYVSLIIILFFFYFLFLWYAKKEKIHYKNLSILVIGTTLVLLLSYNAFSYDLFNYIFDAKIITDYHQNPYLQKALDYPKDPMLSFMHWTHRVYPYGPMWLVLTVPLSFAGLGFFLPTFLFFKGLAAFSFLGSCYLIYKISQEIECDNPIFNTVFFAFNPLILVESLVSAHNDIVMFFFALFSLYLLLRKKHWRALLFFFFSAGVKFSSIFLLPIFIAIFIFQKRKQKINWDRLFLTATISMIIPIVAATLRTNFQPWYLINFLTIASFISKRFFVLISGIIVSFFALAMYVPFLYTGNWNPPIPALLSWLLWIGIILSITAGSGRFLFKCGRKMIQ